MSRSRRCRDEADLTEVSQSQRNSSSANIPRFEERSAASKPRHLAALAALARSSRVHHNHLLPRDGEIPLSTRIMLYYLLSTL